MALQRSCQLVVFLVVRKRWCEVWEALGSISETLAGSFREERNGTTSGLNGWVTMVSYWEKPRESSPALKPERLSSQTSSRPPEALSAHCECAWTPYSRSSSAVRFMSFFLIVATISSFIFGLFDAVMETEILDAADLAADMDLGAADIDPEAPNGGGGTEGHRLLLRGRWSTWGRACHPHLVPEYGSVGRSYGSSTFTEVASDVNTFCPFFLQTSVEPFRPVVHGCSWFVS